MKTYVLNVTETEQGLMFEENTTFSTFEVMGILTHLCQTHSAQLNEELKDYDNKG